jgi:hypothetical protein
MTKQRTFTLGPFFFAWSGDVVGACKVVGLRAYFYGVTWGQFAFGVTVLR